MKTTVDTPVVESEDLMRFTRAAIVTAIAEYYRRRRMAALVEHAGNPDGLGRPDELQAHRRQVSGPCLALPGSQTLYDLCRRAGTCATPVREVHIPPAPLESGDRRWSGQQRAATD
jgi:hypothetical protein